MMFGKCKSILVVAYLWCAFVNAVLAQSINLYEPETFAKITDPKSYSSWIYPKDQKPIVVNASLQVNHFGPIDEEKSQFSMLLSIYLSWFDERLQLPGERNNSLYRLDADRWHLSRIWRPDVGFISSNSITNNLLADGESFGTIYGNGHVKIVKQALINGVCRMNIKLYPIDTLYCTLKLESNSLSTNILRLQWDEETPVQFAVDFQWGSFDLLAMTTFNTQTHYKTSGPFSVVEMAFTVRRQLGYYLLNVYLPSTLFVATSWTSFWIDIPAAPARVALVLTTMLTHVTSTKGIHDKFPKVSYISSLDVWIIMCTMFIFAAVVEYATANYFYHKPSRIRDKKRPEQSAPPADRNNNNINNRNGSRQTSFTNDTDNGSVYEKVGKYCRLVCDKITPPFDDGFVSRRVALNIDRRSRFMFPLLFILFNIIYWITLVIYANQKQSFD